MPVDALYFVGVIAAMALVTFAIRATPFVANRWLKKQAWVNDLGDFLPLAIMVILVIHGLTDAATSHAGGWFAEIVSVAAVVLLQWFWRNSLLSIFSGAALYIALVNGWIPGFS